MKPGVALFFTRWKDLGDGPESEAWRRHLPSRAFEPFPQVVGFELQHGNMCSAFGDCDDFKFDSLLTLGLVWEQSYLFRFRNHMEK
jgi:hypothetical protein